jgi:tetratricopeptide (TPR) repeat protein
LVVVASPDAVRSLWVAREIELFQELHPGAPILVALARGDYGDAVPAALRTGSVEPLAADFRPEGDGKRLAFLKIVAGLARLPLDALVQRDAQRQVRRVTAVTLGAVTLVVIMAGLLVMALQAQAEAERQRAEVEHQRAGAEGLVDFMLTKLRGQLKGVGRPEVMAAVNERAMAYYTAQGDLSRLPDESLDRRAKVLHAMGEDDQDQGRLDKAQAEFAEAHRTTAAMLAKKPGDPERIFTHAQSEYYVGAVAWSRHDRHTATRHMLGYRRQAQALENAEAGSVRALMELGYSEAGLCDLNLTDKYDLKAAEVHCPAALRFEEAALKKAPDDRDVLISLANRHGWMGQAYLDLGRYEDALASRRAEAAIDDRLLALDPANFEYGVRRMWSDIGMANVWIQRGEPARALAVLRACIDRHPKILSSDIKTELVISTRLRLYLFFARALRDLGRDYAREQALADREQRLMAALGGAFAAKAEKIRASIWREGRGVR